MYTSLFQPVKNLTSLVQVIHFDHISIRIYCVTLWIYCFIVFKCVFVTLFIIKRTYFNFNHYSFMQYSLRTIAYYKSLFALRVKGWHFTYRTSLVFISRNPRRVTGHWQRQLLTAFFSLESHHQRTNFRTNGFGVSYEDTVVVCIPCCNDTLSLSLSLAY